MNSRRRYSLAAGVTLGLATMAGADVWDATAAFSIQNGNPNGPWSYAWMDVGFSTLTLLPNHGNGTYVQGPVWWGWNANETPGVWRNAGASILYGVAPGELSLHPGDGLEPCVVRWTAPAGVSGPVSVVGQFKAGHYGSMSVGVRHEGSPVWTAVNAGSFNLVLAVQPGHTIDFAVYGGWYGGNTPLIARIETTCYPDCDRSGTLTVQDFGCFQSFFALGEVYADCSGDGLLTVADFGCFQTRFVAGCP